MRHVLYLGVGSSDTDARQPLLLAVLFLALSATPSKR